MKNFIVLALVLPFTLAIDVKFANRYGTSLKRVEIPSCASEPCPLVKGRPLNITLFVETTYPREVEYPTVSDLESTVGIDGYRNLFVYPVANRDKICKSEPKQCPLELHKEYAIHRQLFLSKDDETTEHTGFGSRNGLIQFMINIVMLAHGDVGTVIADSIITVDVKPAQ